MAANNVSADLVWELTRAGTAYTVKRKTGSSWTTWSRDPFSLRNINSKKNSGLVHEKAVGIVPGEKGGVTLLVKKADTTYQPAKDVIATTFGPRYSTRKTYRSIVNSIGTRYRPDLRKNAVVRASAIRASQVEKKERPAYKPRGKKAKAAAAKAAASA